MRVGEEASSVVTMLLAETHRDYYFYVTP